MASGYFPKMDLADYLELEKSHVELLSVKAHFPVADVYEEITFGTRFSAPD